MVDLNTISQSSPPRILSIFHEKKKKQAEAELCQAQRGLNECCEITSAFDIQFRQSFAKETFSYDEHLKS